MQDDLDAVNRYVERAEEVCVIAATMDDERTRKSLLKIAKDYLRMAQSRSKIHTLGMKLAAPVSVEATSHSPDPRGRTGLAVKFDADEWAVLTPSERMYRCRAWATDAQARAEKAASPELKQTYQSMADQWATLAREIELQVIEASPSPVRPKTA